MKQMLGVMRMGFLLVGGVFLLSPVASAQSTVKLHPYDETLAQELNQKLNGVNVVEDAERNGDYLATLRWETTARTAFSTPGHLTKSETETNANPYETKQHRMKEQKKEVKADEQLKEKKPNLLSKMFGGGKKEEASTAKDGSQEAVETKSEESKESKGFLWGLFGSGDKNKDESGRYHSDAEPFDTKKHRRINVEKSEPEPNARVEDVKPKMSQEPKAAASAPAIVEKAVVPKTETVVEEAAVEVETVSAPAEAAKEKKGIFKSISDTVTKPFTGFGNAEKSYTAEAEFVFPDGRKLTLPSIRTRSESEMQLIMSRLYGQSIQWIKEGKRHYITALNSAAGIRTQEDLEKRIQRAIETPNWLRGGGNVENKKLPK